METLAASYVRVKLFSYGLLGIVTTQIITSIVLIADSMLIARSRGLHRQPRASSLDKRNTALNRDVHPIFRHRSRILIVSQSGKLRPTVRVRPHLFLLGQAFVSGPILNKSI